MARRGHAIAIVATARKMAKLFWHLLVREQVLGLVGVAQVERVHRQVPSAERLEPVDDRRLGVGEVVDDEDVVTGGDELEDGVGADVAGSSADEDAHEHTVGAGVP